MLEFLPINRDDENTVPIYNFGQSIGNIQLARVWGLAANKEQQHNTSEH